MSTQIGERVEFDLAALNGQCFAWHLDFNQPWLIDIEGEKFVPVFPDDVALIAGLRSVDVKSFRVKRIDDAEDFIASLAEAGVKVCLNLRRVDERLRYTEIQIG